jgi:uncharacterized protein
MATPLIVNVVELLRWPGTTKDVVLSIAATDLEFGESRISDEPVEINLHLEALSNGVTVNGTTSATWAGECRRCLTPMSARMTIELSELYQQMPDDSEAYVIDNDQINLLPMVRENLLLAVPLGPLCREDCPGFCPHCGKDLSESECSCDNTVIDPRWAALETLKGSLKDPSE